MVTQSLNLYFIKRKLPSQCIAAQSSKRILAKNFALYVAWCTLKQEPNWSSLSMVLLVEKIHNGQWLEVFSQSG